MKGVTIAVIIAAAVLLGVLMYTQSQERMADQRINAELQQKQSQQRQDAMKVYP